MIRDYKEERPHSNGVGVPVRVKVRAVPHLSFILIGGGAASPGERRRCYHSIINHYSLD